MKRTIILFISCISLFSCSDDTFRNDYETERLAIRLKEQAPALVFGPTITSITESIDPDMNTTTIKVRLTAPPESDVTLDLSPVLSYGLNVVPDRVVFNSGNYSVEQEIDISTSNDDLVGGTKHYKIQFPQLSSIDPLYNNKAVPELDITVFEDDYYPVAYPVNPYKDQPDVPVYQQIYVSFSKDMDSTTINGTTFRLERMSGSTPVETMPFFWAYNSSTRTATYAPKTFFQLNTTYRATVLKNTKDNYGNPLSEETTWSFQVKNWEAKMLGQAGYGTTNAMHIQTGRAYIANTVGMAIQDISDPYHPVLVGNLTIGSSCTGIYSTGKYAYIANGTSGLRTVDCQNQYAPALVDTDDTIGNAYSIHVKNSYVYVADGTNGLEVFSISTPANPTRAGGYNTGSRDCRFVYVMNNLAYIANGSYGLLILDVTNPTSPSLKGSLDTTGTALGVHTWGKYAYIADDGAGLQIIDVSNPSSPVLKGTYKDTSIESVKSVYVSGHTAYLAAHRAGSNNRLNGLWIVDVTNPSAPRFMDTWGLYDNQTDPLHIWIEGRYGYLSLGHEGGRVIEISTPFTSVELSHYDLPGNQAMNIQIADNYVYVADGTNGLQVIDIGNPISPQLVSTFDTPGSAQDLVVSENYAYVADYTAGLQVIDLTKQPPLHIVGKLDTLGDNSRGVYVDGTYAYMANGLNGLRKINISTPSNPTLSGTCDTPGDAWGVIVSGNYAYVADAYTVANSAGLRVINITTSPPTLVKRIDISCEGGRRLVKQGNLIYMSFCNCGMVIFDVTDPLNAYIKGTGSNIYSVFGIAVQGNYAFMNQNTLGLWFWDVFDPANPRLSEDYTDSSDGQTALQVSGNYAYNLNTYTGLHILYHPWWWADQK